MDDVLRIQSLKHEEGKTYAEIAEALRVSSKTIAKALHRVGDFAEGYRSPAARPRPALGPYLGRIGELLEGRPWAQARGRRVRRTARWVWRKIRQEGFTGGESTVRAYIREHLKQPQAACPIEHAPADEVQFDFGQSLVKVGREVLCVHFVGAIFPYSTRRFLFAYRAERQECLFDAIERTYVRAGGVSVRATLDNTKLAVKKVLQGRGRVETEAYARFRTALGVSARYTNVAAGWEKGHVEGTVGWAKRQVLVDLEVKDWEELEKLLDRSCEEDAGQRRYGESGKLVGELFEEERGLLVPLSYQGRRSYKRVRARVSPSGRVEVDRSRYSVPIGLRGRWVRVHLFADEVVVLSESREVARHRRDWKGRGEHYELEHYLPLLKRAPALLDHGKPFVRMPEWLARLRAALGEDAALIELLLGVEAGRYGLGDLEEAAKEALGSGSVRRGTLQEAALRRAAGRSRAVVELGEEEFRAPEAAAFTIGDPRSYDAMFAVTASGGRRCADGDS